jgi:hypothetical protein
VPPQQSIDALVHTGYQRAILSLTKNKLILFSIFDSSIEQQMTPILGKRAYLKRQEGKCRIIIFDGEHEWTPSAAMK